MIIAGDTPVIFFNRPIGTREDPDHRVFAKHDNACFIGTDGPQAGKMQGMLIGGYVLEHYEDLDLNGDGLISYAMFQGDEADLEAIYRTQYSVEDADLILTANGRQPLQYFDPAAPEDHLYQADPDGAWSAASARAFLEENLKTFREENNNMIELIICNNDDMAEGAIAALQELGYNNGSGRVIPVFGVDATASAKALIAGGFMTATVKQDAEGMAVAIRQTVEGIAEGKTPADALAGLTDSRFSLDAECPSKLYISYETYDVS